MVSGVTVGETRNDDNNDKNEKRKRNFSDMFISDVIDYDVMVAVDVTIVTSCGRKFWMITYYTLDSRGCLFHSNATLQKNAGTF